MTTTHAVCAVTEPTDPVHRQPHCHRPADWWLNRCRMDRCWMTAKQITRLSVYCGGAPYLLIECFTWAFPDSRSTPGGVS